MNPMDGDPGATLQQKSLKQLLDMCDKVLLKLADREDHIGRLLHGSHVNARGLFLAITALLLALLLPRFVEWSLRKTGRMELNFRGDNIPQSYGAFILLFGGILLALCKNIYFPATRNYTIWQTVVIGFGLLGLTDDILGDRSIKGFSGHLTSVFKNHRLTTGFIKLLGGGLFALWAGWVLEPNSVWLILLDASILSLSANALNLLDLRPGRASGFFLFAALILFWFEAPFSGNGVPPLLLIIIPTALLWIKDSQAQCMMGDVGSNLLGASLGLALCSPPFSVSIKVLFLILLISLHLLTERKSLTKIIENNRILSFLDGLNGVR